MKNNKLIVFVISLQLVFAFSSCGDYDIPNYNFFTNDEIAEICINPDSVLFLQSKMEIMDSYKDYIGAKNFYSENDTAFFIEDNGKIIRAVCGSSIIIELQCNTFFIQSSSDSHLSAYFEAVDDCFISSLAYDLYKSSRFSNIKRVLIYQSKDSIIDADPYYLNNIDWNMSDSMGFKSKIEKFNWQGEIIEQCSVINGFNSKSEEIFEMVYSNKIGILLIKCRNHVIERKKITATNTIEATGCHSGEISLRSARALATRWSE